MSWRHGFPAPRMLDLGRIRLEERRKTTRLAEGLIWLTVLGPTLACLAIAGALVLLNLWCAGRL